MRRPARKWLRRLGAGWVGAGLTVAASFWAGYNFNTWTGRAPVPTARTEAAIPAAKSMAHAGDVTPSSGTIFVRRDGSVLRDAPKWSAHALAHKKKGAAVALLEAPHDGWAKVRDGNTTGWMRASVLGDDPSPGPD